MKTAVYLVCSNLISIMCYFILFMLYCLSTKFIKPLSICILLTVWNFFKVSQSFISHRHVLFLVAMNLLLSDYMFMFSILLTNDAIYLWVNNLNAGYLVHGKKLKLNTGWWEKLFWFLNNFFCAYRKMYSLNTESFIEISSALWYNKLWTICMEKISQEKVVEFC